MRSLMLLLFVLTAAPAYAVENSLLNLETRPGVTVEVFYMKQVKATATVALLPGASGNLGMRRGVPTAVDFLIKSRGLFATHGFNVAIIGAPSDQDHLGFDFRVSTAHIEDLRQIVAYLKKDAG